MTCPQGKYSISSGCVTCSSGYYGTDTNLIRFSCNGPCSASSGLYCIGGSSYTHGYDVCPIGNYCPGGLPGKALACPSGFYGSETGLSASTCSGPCTAAPGYACAATAFSPVGIRCGAGFYCAGGSASSQYCDAGYYGSSTGNSVSTCNGACTAVAGRTCNTSYSVLLTHYIDSTLSSLPTTYRFTINSPTGIACPIGYYCDGSNNGMHIAQCDLGFFGSSTGLSVSTCNGPCTAGPGKRCLAGSTLATGLICLSGFYCEGGSSPQPCMGKYTTGGNASTSECHGSCLAGYYGIAINGLTTPPTCQGMCPANTYCPTGTAVPIACGAGSFSARGSTQLSDCQPIPAQNNSVNNSFVFPGPLPSSYVLDTLADRLFTPLPTYNPDFVGPFGPSALSIIRQSIATTLAVTINSVHITNIVTNYSGFVVLNYTIEYTIDGPALSDANSGATTLTTILDGKVADIITNLKNNAPLGTALNNTSYLDGLGAGVSTLDILECLLGQYNDGVVCQSCTQGYYGSETGLVTDTCSGPCDMGYYGEDIGLSVTTCSGPCEMGYYGSQPGRTHSTCNGPCEAGSYGSIPGLMTSACSGPCQSGYYGDVGETVSTCTGLCPPNFYCPVGSGDPTPCPQNGTSYAGAVTESECTPDPNYIVVTTTTNKTWMIVFIVACILVFFWWR